MKGLGGVLLTTALVAGKDLKNYRERVWDQ